MNSLDSKSGHQSVMTDLESFRMDNAVYLGIVGTSNPLNDSVANSVVLAYVKNFVENSPALETFGRENLCIVSGGAKGIDTIAENVAGQLGIHFRKFMPKSQTWEHFKERNLKIADMCNKVVSFVNPLYDQKCYHCENAGKDNNHERSGGCYTGRMNGNYEVVVIDSKLVESKTMTSSDSSKPSSKVFVFGSNRRGIHGAGAAKFARENHGAVLGKGEGLYGSSYAIPTKSDPYHSLKTSEVEAHVNKFIEFAKEHPELTFQLTPIGCGLAGFSPREIAPMFKDAPSNVEIPKEFSAVLGKM